MADERADGHFTNLFDAKTNREAKQKVGTRRLTVSIIPPYRFTNLFEQFTNLFERFTNLFDAKKDRFAILCWC